MPQLLKVLIRSAKNREWCLWGVKMATRQKHRRGFSKNPSHSAAAEEKSIGSSNSGSRPSPSNNPQPAPVPVTANHNVNNGTVGDRSPVRASLGCSLGKLAVYSSLLHGWPFESEADSSLRLSAARSVGSVVISSLTFPLTGLDLMTRPWGQTPPRAAVSPPNLNWETTLPPPPEPDWLSSVSPPDFAFKLMTKNLSLIRERDGKNNLLLLFYKFVTINGCLGDQLFCFLSITRPPLFYVCALLQLTACDYVMEVLFTFSSVAHPFS